jgi:hypothetical protein
MKTGGFIALVLGMLIGIAFAQEISNIVPVQPKTSVEFFQEEITFIVNDSIARVEGVYHFRNNLGRAFDMPVMFPFHVDSTTAYPDLIEAYIADSTGHRRALDFVDMPERECIRMRIPMAAGPETIWNLNYEQRISAERAVYVITSTAAWQKPLEKATYTFITPASFKDVEVWPEPDTTFIENGMAYRRCVKYNFMPKREMTISWK